MENRINDTVLNAIVRSIIEEAAEWEKGHMHSDNFFTLAPEFIGLAGYSGASVLVCVAGYAKTVYDMATIGKNGLIDAVKDFRDYNKQLVLSALLGIDR